MHLFQIWTRFQQATPRQPGGAAFSDSPIQARAATNLPLLGFLFWSFPSPLIQVFTYTHSNTLIHKTFNGIHSLQFSLENCIHSLKDFSQNALLHPNSGPRRHRHSRRGGLPIRPWGGPWNLYGYGRLQDRLRRHCPDLACWLQRRHW